MNQLNARRLMRLYDCLAVWERIPLLLAADSRNDETERARLFETSPVRTWHMSEHLMAEQALHVLALSYITEQLDAAAIYFFSLMQFDNETAENEADRDSADWLLSAQATAYFFTANASAWRRFCEELQIDHATLTSGNYRGWFLGFCEERMPAHAPSATDLTLRMQQRGRKVSRLVTEESLLAGWRKSLQAMTRYAPPHMKEPS